MAALNSGATRSAIDNLTLATRAEKCRACGCFAGSLRDIEQAAGSSPELAATIAAARERLTPTRYDCLGCAVCWPAVALNAVADAAGLELAGAACVVPPVVERTGWPPLPGSYRVLRFRAPVAVCTLDDDTLADTLAAGAGPQISIVGTMRTENLGIERLISNVVANPNIRFLVLAGSDVRQLIGHLPGQSLVALAANGLDSRGRIVGAPGKRPILKNVAPELVEHFRQKVEIVDRIGETDCDRLALVVAECAARDPGPTEVAVGKAVPVTAGRLPARTISDPAGYFVVYAEPRLSLEHFTNAGVLDRIVEGGTSAELYMTAIEQGLVTRLDHAAYLGRELARAESVSNGGKRYVQDAAPDASVAPGCGCADGTCAATET